MFESIDAYIESVRCENRARHDKAKRLWMISASGTFADALTRCFLWEAQNVLVNGVARDLLRSEKVSDWIHALECAYAAYLHECETLDPKKVFGVYATIHYP